MPPFRARRPRPPDESHECEYRQAVARVRIDLEQASAMHGRNVPVSAAKVLDLMNPRGMWRHIGSPTQPMEEMPDEEGLDPVTGCRPVTARRPASS
jgi:hypothetical protein